MPEKKTIRIAPDYEPRRLDVALHDLKLYLTRAQGKRAVQNDLVTVNGVAQKAGTKVKAGDVIEAIIPDLLDGPEAENIPLDVIYEDDDIIVIDKPAGIVVHPAAGNRTGTMVNALLHGTQNLSGIGGVLRPGVVHRLDKDTSGIIVFAKNDVAHNNLCDQFRARSVKKIYLALVVGNMPQASGAIESAIARDPLHRTRMKGGAKEGSGREAKTLWTVVERYPGATLLEVAPHTGRTHQIRVHLSEAGHPVVGDKVYGTKHRLKGVRNAKARSALEAMNRQALHAHKLTITIPSTGEQRSFVSEPPEDMARLISLLRNAERNDDKKPQVAQARRA